MTREAALLVTLGIVVVLLGLGVAAWVRRSRRDAGLAAPVGEIPAEAVTTHRASGFYVATTRRDEPLERLAIRGLGFRSRADVTVTDRGVGIELVGGPALFLPVARIADVELATVAIDRVVEPGGLVRLTWQSDRSGAPREAVDTYLRPQDGSARALADAIDATLTAAAPAPGPSAAPDPTATPTGTDA